ncbi:MAG: hypothetical protein V3V78_04450 [Candidatus Woesearchaeota archaeon]
MSDIADNLTDQDKRILNQLMPSILKCGKDKSIQDGAIDIGLRAISLKKDLYAEARSYIRKKISEYETD